MKKLLFLLLALLPFVAQARKQKAQPLSDREVWTSLLYRMAQPVLEPMSEGRLQSVMTYESGNLEVSPTWDGRNKKVTYMEAFGRLMAGLAPWLSLPDDSIATPAGLVPTAESQQRHQLREWALRAYAHAVDPASPDYLGWHSGGQTLVDAAYLVESFLRGWDALWVPLDSLTKQRYIHEIQGLHRYEPPYTNWLLFVAMEECFLMKAGAPWDGYRIKMALSKIEEWYVGDGWYADGPSFAFDYYNSYVIQPMYVECLETIAQQQGNNRYLVRTLDPVSYRQLAPADRLAQATLRMQKYASILERFISPEGTYPVFGRSIPYRTAVLQPLAMLAWRRQLPEGLSNGQVRAAMTAVLRNMYAADLSPSAAAAGTKSNFNSGGFLTIGFVGSHPDVADIYTNNGSLYMTSLSFLPLGLPANDPFWTDPAEPWTSRKAWLGMDFPKDHKWRINPQILYWE